MSKKSSHSAHKRVAIQLEKFHFHNGPPNGVEKGEGEQALQPFHDRIAKIASHWSVFELALDQTIWHLADVAPEKGACMTAQFGSTYLRFKAILALVRMLPESDDLVREINRFSTEMEGIVRKRNRAIHDPVIYNTAQKCVDTYRVTADKTLDFGFQKAEYAEYDDTMRDIIKCRKDFEILKTKIFQHASVAGRRSR